MTPERSTHSASDSTYVEPDAPHQTDIELRPAGSPASSRSLSAFEAERRHGPVLAAAVEEAGRSAAFHRETVASGRAEQAVTQLIRADHDYHEAISLPHRTRKRWHVWLAQVAKPSLVLGDTVVLGAMWWRAGQPLALALTAGFATGLVMVTTGSKAGQESQLTVHRRQRGPRPRELSASVSHLFSDGRDRLPWWWILLCVMLGAAALAALTMIGVAVGDRTGLAVAAGLFAAMTLVGSAAVEAYGTNQAADLVDQRATELASAKASLEAIDQLAADASAASARAELLDRQR